MCCGETGAELIDLDLDLLRRRFLAASAYSADRAAKLDAESDLEASEKSLLVLLPSWLESAEIKPFCRSCSSLFFRFILE